jgi:hypothetical protein
MTFTRTLACTLAAAIAGTAAAAAQEAPPRTEDRAQLRHQIYVMEGALSRAVEFGAQTLNGEIRAFMPEAFVLAGQARARGVYLDGYGVFFDVEVPILRQSMMWSLRTMLDQDAAGLQKAISDLREIASKAPDTASREQAERALSRIELQLAPMGFPGPGAVVANPFQAAVRERQGQGGSATVQAGAPVDDDAANAAAAAAAEAPARAPKDLPIDRLWMKDPNRAYTESVQRALVDAMIDFSAPMAIGPEEWLTVAARDNYQRDSLAPPDPLEEVETIIIRIKGADLAAYRSGQIDRAEARARVVVSAF